jgi:hypothetical protein
MSKFNSERDERVHAMAVDSADEEIGRVDTCLWQGRVTFNPSDGIEGFHGAIVTEDHLGFVYVTYHKTSTSLHIDWNNVLTQHDGCCDEDFDEWPEILFAEPRLTTSTWEPTSAEAS